MEKNLEALLWRSSFHFIFGWGVRAPTRGVGWKELPWLKIDDNFSILLHEMSVCLCAINTTLIIENCRKGL